jgi:uncharacterized repeat protein (TIGR01451 family)
VRRLACWIVLSALLGGAAVAGCGGGPTSLSVVLALADQQSSSVASGQTITFVITVTDAGAAGTSGLTVTADLPADFRYMDTEALGEEGGTVRTSPVDAQGNSRQPTWGVWELSGHKDDVSIKFDALAEGSPGSYTMTASASGSSTGGSTQSSGLALKLTPAPQLSASVSVSPSQAVPGQDVTYEVSVFNNGTGPATGVSVTVTLPPVFIFDGGMQILGNSGRSGGMSPVQGSAIPFFDGFEVPAHSGSTPGQLIIKFNARVLTDAGAVGTYLVGVQVLGDAGVERVDIADSAPVSIG